MQSYGKKLVRLLLLLVAAAVLASCGTRGTETGSGDAVSAPSEETVLRKASSAVLSDSPVCISEVMVKNHSTLRSADGNFYDWIELENVSGEDVRLGGWQISDRENKTGWCFPEVTIPAGEQLLVYAAKTEGTGGELHADFALSDGETLFLRDPAGRTACTVLCTGVMTDRSLVRTEDGSYCESLYPTPAYPNSAEGYDAWQESLAKPAGLVINEVMVENFGVKTKLDDIYCDWVELKNLSDAPVELSDYCLSDDEDDLTFYRLPQKSLAPGECFVVRCTGGKTAGAPFKLDSTQEQLFLSDAAGVLADFCALRDIPYECSYGRCTGKSGFFYFSVPTPGTENGKGYRRVSASPVSLTADGVYEDTKSVSVELSGKGKIYYTLDTSHPDASCTEYTAPVPVTKTCVLRAVCVEEGAMPSRPLELSFILNEKLTLPAVSLVADDLSEFNYIYYQSKKDVEIPASLSFYEDGGSFTIGCGVKMNGMTSLGLLKKNLSLRFRGAYGQEMLEYDLYGGGVTEFTNLVLRAGQDYYSAIIRNELCQELCLQMGDSVITQRTRFCVLFVNGKYFGIYALKEKTNEQLYASLSGTSKDSVTMEEAHLKSDSQFYQEVWLPCTSWDMSKPDNYQYFCDRVDVDSLIDWMVIEGYCANDDLTAGNVRYTRSTENDGKWRLVFYDLDSSLASPDKNFYNIIPNGNSYVSQISALILSLLENDEFRDRFLTRAGYHLNHALTNENAVAVLTRLAGEIDAEVERDYFRADMTKRKWKDNIQYLTDFFIKNDWRQHNIDTLCRIFKLSDAEREQYFGAA